MNDLSERRCIPCEGGVTPLDRPAALRLLADVPEWRLDDSGKHIQRAFRFKNFHETMAFANKVAEIANREDHHPDMEISYSRCLVRYSTHAINGLSENDFICATAIDAII